ncbi:PASTA domain-containing protein [Dactylosporangium sp. CA-139066]|uniref:PASTA domain-containing protein n=1 Tax=Dactylosporangium sp. CA-139066 TaxID=3239930 RepID=UPI003D91BA03
MSNSADRSPDPHGDEPTVASGPTGPSDADATQIHPRVRGGSTRPQPAAGDETTQPHRAPEPDATQPHRPGEPDATQPHRPGEPDATRVQGAGDGTRVQPAADEGERWSARAGVPSPEEALRRAAPQQQWVEEEDPYQGRSWLTPVIVGIVALVLVAALSVGLYLIYRATANGNNAPAGEEPSVATAAPAPPVPASTPPPESSPPPSSEPPSSAPAGQVVIPPLRGDALAEATVKLQVLGLNVAVERRADASLPAGEVLSTRPGEGTTVTAGDTVTLIVAAPPSPAPSKPRASSSPSPANT